MSTASAAYENLGSLSQSVRSERLKSARTILYIVGVLSVLANLFFLFLAKSQVDQVFDEEVATARQQGMIVDEAKVLELKQSATRSAQLINGGGVIAGIVFLILGANVYRYPVATTATGLVLYLGLNALFGYIDPMNLAHGWLIKIIIVVSLFKAVQSAVAYEKELKDQERNQSPAIETGEAIT
jgi:hypothetical protein